MQYAYATIDFMKQITLQLSTTMPLKQLLKNKHLVSVYDFSSFFVPFFVISFGCLHLLVLMNLISTNNNHETFPCLPLLN